MDHASWRLLSNWYRACDRLQGAGTDQISRLQTCRYILNSSASGIAFREHLGQPIQSTWVSQVNLSISHWQLNLVQSAPGVVLLPGQFRRSHHHQSLDGWSLVSELCPRKRHARRWEWFGGASSTKLPEPWSLAQWPCSWSCTVCANESCHTGDSCPRYQELLLCHTHWSRSWRLEFSCLTCFSTYRFSPDYHYLGHKDWHVHQQILRLVLYLRRILSQWSPWGASQQRTSLCPATSQWQLWHHRSYPRQDSAAPLPHLRTQLP